MTDPEITIKASELKHIRDTLARLRDQGIPILRNLWSQVAGLYQRKMQEQKSAIHDGRTANTP